MTVVDRYRGKGERNAMASTCRVPVGPDRGQVVVEELNVPDGVPGLLQQHIRQHGRPASRSQLTALVASFGRQPRWSVAKSARRTAT